MHSSARSVRSTNRQNSVFTASNTEAITSLRAKIKSLDKSSNDTTLEYDPFSYGVEIAQEQVIIFEKSKTVRRAYLLENKYRIGWVVDCDLNVCMLCWREFGWYRGRPKHHCRACGALVCHECSPYTTDIPVLLEEKGSRVCRNCFGLKSGIFSPMGTETAAIQRPPVAETVATNLFQDTPKAVGVTTPTRRNNKPPKVESEEKMMQRYLEEMEKIDQEQLPKYEEAYRIMREIIPLDIYKSKISRLRKRGLPEECANRVWNTKILWLIVTNPEDIKKIHLADFRSKYFYDGLDMVEMRAIWYNLPKWNFDSENPLEKGKAEWRDGFKSKLDDLAYKEAVGKLTPNQIRHSAYEEADFLHLFDPTLPLLPRFHRSASYKQNPILSPEGEDAFATPEPQNHYSPFCDSSNGHAVANFQDRKKKYMNNFEEAPGSADRREQKYRTLVDEINAEPDDIDIYGEELEYEEEGEEDISSLEDVSTEELYHPQNQKPFHAVKSSQQLLKDKDNESRSSSSYKTPLNNQGGISLQKGKGLTNSNSASDLQTISKKYSSSSSSFQNGSSTAAGKSLHSAQAIHSIMTKETNSQNVTPTKSALKQSLTNQSTTSSISTLSQQYGRNPVASASANNVKFKSAEIPVQGARSTSKVEKEYQEPLSKSLHAPSTLSKAFSFHGESVSAYANGKGQHPRTTLDSNRLSPLRITSTNSLVTRSGSSSGGKANNHQISNSSSSQNNRDYPILKPRMSLETPNDNVIDLYATPPSVDTIPGQMQSEKWKSHSKFAINNVDLETPASNTFTTVDSVKSYKFLSTSKKHIANINDFDSPDIFPAYGNDADNDNFSNSYHTPLADTPTVTPSTKFIPVSGTKGTKRQQQQQQPQQPKQQQQQPQQQQQQLPTNTNKATSQLSASFTRSTSRNAGPIQSHSASTINTTNNNTNLQKLRYKEELKLHLLVGNISKTIAILNESSTRLTDCFTKAEATEILWQCISTENEHDIPLANQSILFLLDEKIIDVNSQNQTKQESILLRAVMQDNEYLGRELVRRGADILLADNEGLCPLALSLTYHYDWLIDEFTNSGREIQLLSKGSADVKFQYVTFFILAGYARKAYDLIEQEYVAITPEEATDLLNSCRGNFQSMKDPVETFELLENLGATVDFD